MRLSKDSQSLIEYSVALVLIISGILIGGPYAKRAINAHLKTWEQTVDDSLSDDIPAISYDEISSAIPPPCNYDGNCDKPQETPFSCCYDCPEPEGVKICCPALLENAQDNPECAVCGDFICNTEKENINNCCMDCGGDIPDDGVCCRDNEGNPAGRDVGNKDCGVEVCDYDNHCSTADGEGVTSCCHDCHTCPGNGCEQPCESIYPTNGSKENRNFQCTADCCTFECGENGEYCDSKIECMQYCPLLCPCDRGDCLNKPGGCATTTPRPAGQAECSGKSGCKWKWDTLSKKFGKCIQDGPDCGDIEDPIDCDSYFYCHYKKLIFCGNGICEYWCGAKAETIDNCPQDCLCSEAFCNEQYSLDLAEISDLYGPFNPAETHCCTASAYDFEGTLVEDCCAPVYGCLNWAFDFSAYPIKYMCTPISPATKLSGYCTCGVRSDMKDWGVTESGPCEFEDKISNPIMCGPQD